MEEENPGGDHDGRRGGRGPSPPPPLPSRRSLLGDGGEALAGSPGAGGAGTGGKLESFVGFGRPPGRMSPRYETPPGTPPPPYFGDNQEVSEEIATFGIVGEKYHVKPKPLWIGQNG